MWSHRFWLKITRTGNKVWAGKFSWCKSQEMLFYKSASFFSLLELLRNTHYGSLDLNAEIHDALPLKSLSTVSFFQSRRVRIPSKRWLNLKFEVLTYFVICYHAFQCHDMIQSICQQHQGLRNVLMFDLMLCNVLWYDVMSYLMWVFWYDDLICDMMLYAGEIEQFWNNIMIWSNWYANIIRCNYHAVIPHNRFFHFFYTFIGCWCVQASKAFSSKFSRPSGKHSLAPGLAHSRLIMSS